MKKCSAIFLVLVFWVTYSLPVVAKTYKKMSQLEINEAQTHVYPTSNKEQVFKATINTLQDEGFTIINIEDELGYIRAKKEYKGRRTDKKRVTIYSLVLACDVACIVLAHGAGTSSLKDPILRLTNELADKTVVVDTNANIDSFGTQTKVKLTMIEKVLYNADGYSYVKSSPRNVVRIYNPLIYHTFFEELDKSIFYENI